MPRPLPQIQSYPLQEYGLRPQLPDYFDSSMIRDFIDCPSKFYLRHVLGLRPRDSGLDPNLEWGSKWHEVMYAFHHNRNIDEAIEALDPWPREVLNEAEKKARTRKRMMKFLIEYAKKYDRLDELEWDTLMREQYFELECESTDSSCPLGGCGLSWCGRIDRIAEQTQTGKVYLWDYKTTGRLRSTFYDEQKHGFQIPGYVWAALHLTTEAEDFVGAFIDLLYCTKTKSDMERRELRFTPHHLLDWRENVKRIVDRIRSMWDSYSHDPEAWDRNRQECYRYSNCAFVNVHDTPPIRDTRYRIMAQDYVEDRWDPSDSLP